MDSLKTWSEKGVSEYQLETMIGRAEANAIFGLESVRGKVTQLASNETFLVNRIVLKSSWNSLERLLQTVFNPLISST